MAFSRDDNTDANADADAADTDDAADANASGIIVVNANVDAADAADAADVNSDDKDRVRGERSQLNAATCNSEVDLQNKRCFSETIQ